MLKKAKRLPQRYNRPVTKQTRDLARRRHTRKKQRRTERTKRTLQRWRRRAGALRSMAKQFAVLIVVGVSLLLIGMALFSPVLHIRTIIVQPRSEPRLDEQTIQAALAPLFGEHLFFTTPGQVRELVQGAIADIDSIQIEKQYPGTLQVTVSLDPIIAQLEIVEPDENQLQAGSGATAGSGEVLAGTPYLTNEGMYVRYNPIQVHSASGLLLLRIVDWGVRPQPWTIFIEPEMLDRMKEAEALLQDQFNITVTGRTVFQRAREFHLHTPSVTFWIDMRSSLQEQMQRYRIMLQTAGADAATEYIDLRLKDRIIYK